VLSGKIVLAVQEDMRQGVGSETELFLPYGCFASEGILSGIP
jgi:hypothetical protein